MNKCSALLYKARTNIAFVSVVGFCIVSGGFSARAAEYYVNPDATKASDSYDGKAAVWDGVHGPKLTLVGVMDVAKTSGDVVHAARGHYTNGTMTVTFGGNTQRTLNRVVIPAGVTLTADEGREVTFIEGEAAPEENRVGSYSNGVGAVRCVYMKQGARLHNFTLCGGHVKAGSDTDDNSEQGAAVHCEGNWNNTQYRNKSVITDCMISNNVGCTYAIVSYGTYYRCRFLHNRITNWGGVCNGVFYNCVVDYNFGGSYQVCRPYAFVNGVIGQNCTSYCTSGSSANTQRCYFNSIVMGSPHNSTLYNCLYVGTLIGDSKARGGSRQVTVAQLNLDGDYRPLPGSVAIDVGTNEFYAASLSATEVAETEWATGVWESESVGDIVGNARTQGERIDIGAYEFDPAPRTFYVDPVMGDDGNDGRLPTSAFRTLARTMSDPWLYAGDTVLLKPGSYAEGVRRRPDAESRSRQGGRHGGGSRREAGGRGHPRCRRSRCEPGGGGVRMRKRGYSLRKAGRRLRYEEPHAGGWARLCGRHDSHVSP